MKSIKNTTFRSKSFELGLCLIMIIFVVFGSVKAMNILAVKFYIAGIEHTRDSIVQQYGEGSWHQRFQGLNVDKAMKFTTVPDIVTHGGGIEPKPYVNSENPGGFAITFKVNGGYRCNLYAKNLTQKFDQVLVNSKLASNSAGAKSPCKGKDNVIELVTYRKNIHSLSGKIFRPTRD